MTKINALRKEERLKSKKAISELFESGNTLFLYPFRIYWKSSTADDQKCAARMVISVSKKIVNHAVDRNLIKRRIREAYRKNKHELYEFLNKRQQKTDLNILYLHKESLSYAVIEQAIKKVLRLLKHKIESAI